MIAGLIRAIVQAYYEQVRRAEDAPRTRLELLRAAHRRAARYRIDGELIDVIAHRSRPAAKLIEQVLATVQPALQATGDWDEVSSLVHRTLSSASTSPRCRVAYRQNECREDVVDFVVAETMKGIA